MKQLWLAVWGFALLVLLNALWVFPVAISITGRESGTTHAIFPFVMAAPFLLSLAEVVAFEYVRYWLTASQPRGEEPAWVSGLRRAGQLVQSIFDLRDRLEPIGVLGAEEPPGPEEPSADRIVRTAEVNAAECVWVSGGLDQPEPESALVEVEWSGAGPLRVALRGWLATGPQRRVWLRWCSPGGETRATAEAGLASVDVLEMSPRDGQGPRPGDILLVRHVREQLAPWEVLFGLRF